MPKMKTKKIVRKRFKITGTGKIVHRMQGARHLRSKKNKVHQRRQDAPQIITNTKYSVNIKRFLQT
jgi:large subunit ribosomal protein L35